MPEYKFWFTFSSEDLLSLNATPAAIKEALSLVYKYGNPKIEVDEKMSGAFLEFDKPIGFPALKARAVDAKFAWIVDFTWGERPATQAPSVMALAMDKEVKLSDKTEKKIAEKLKKQKYAAKKKRLEEKPDKKPKAVLDESSDDEDNNQL